MKAEDEHDFIVTSSKDCTVQVTKKNAHLAVLAMHNSPVLLQKNAPMIFQGCGMFFSTRQQNFIRIQ